MIPRDSMGTRQHRREVSRKPAGYGSLRDTRQMAESGEQYRPVFITRYVPVLLSVQQQYPRYLNVLLTASYTRISYPAGTTAVPV